MVYINSLSRAKQGCYLGFTPIRIPYTFGHRVYGIQFGVNIGTPLMKRQTWNDYSTIPHAWKLYTKGRSWYGLTSEKTLRT